MMSCDHIFMSCCLCAWRCLNESEICLTKIGYHGVPLGSEKHFSILHSSMHFVNKTWYLEVLCLHVEKNPEASKEVHASSFITNLEWLTFSSGTIFLKPLPRETCTEFLFVEMY